MMLNDLFDPRKSLNLFDLKEKFIALKQLIVQNKLPKVLMLTGDKGLGKSTLIFHLMHYYFDKNNYDEINKKINNSSFHYEFLNNLFPNIIYLGNQNLNNLKIEDVRKLKNDISKSSISKKKRFIILDDIETQSVNSLNALLKLIEEPSENNYFILINNKSQKILETIKSRAIDIQIILNDQTKNKITKSLLNYYNQESSLSIDIVKLSPGNFLKFNYILNEKKIDINDSFLITIKKILNIYKKEKNLLYRDLLLFHTEYYFQNKNIQNNFDENKFIEKKLFLFKNIHEFFSYNLNHNTFLNSIESRFNYD